MAKESSPDVRISDAELAACGPADSVDGDDARSVLRSLVTKAPSSQRRTPRHALAVLQARLYDARFEDAEARGNAAVKDTAGVEEVKDVMASEAHAFRAALRAARRRQVRVVDFGAGDGRFCAEFARSSQELDLDLLVVAYEVSPGALRALRRRCLDGLNYHEDAEGRLRCGRVSVVHASGDPCASAAEVSALLRRALSSEVSSSEVSSSSSQYPFDVVLSGWGSTSAIPDLPDQPQRQQSFVRAFAALAPTLVQIVSSPNNFLGPQRTFQELRQKGIPSQVRLATTPGSFYYPVAGRDYFYSAVSADAEARRLADAGFNDVHVVACNVASFRDLTANPVLRKLEARFLHYVNRNDHDGLRRFLLAAVAKATKRPLSALRDVDEPLFNPARSLVDQLARYIISVSFQLPQRRPAHRD